MQPATRPSKLTYTYKHIHTHKHFRTRETAQFIKQRDIMLRDVVDPSLEYSWTSMRPRVRIYMYMYLDSGPYLPIAQIEPSSAHTLLPKPPTYHQTQTKKGRNRITDKPPKTNADVPPNNPITQAWLHLDELFAGICDGLTYEGIEKHYLEEFARRSIDKLACRYPRGIYACLFAPDGARASSYARTQLIPRHPLIHNTIQRRVLPRLH